MVLYLASIPKEDIAEYFDPYNVKEKWQRFFNASSYKAQFDIERTLKNDYNKQLGEFIMD